MRTACLTRRQHAACVSMTRSYLLLCYGDVESRTVSIPCTTFLSQDWKIQYTPFKLSCRFRGSEKSFQELVNTVYTFCLFTFVALYCCFNSFDHIRQPHELNYSFIETASKMHSLLLCHWIFVTETRSITFRSS